MVQTFFAAFCAVTECPSLNQSFYGGKTCKERLILV